MVEAATRPISMAFFSASLQTPLQFDTSASHSVGQFWRGCPEKLVREQPPLTWPFYALSFSFSAQDADAKLEVMQPSCSHKAMSTKTKLYLILRKAEVETQRGPWWRCGATLPTLDCICWTCCERKIKTPPGIKTV